MIDIARLVPADSRVDHRLTVDDKQNGVRMRLPVVVIPPIRFGV
jgi:hypothetical protein